MNTLHFKLILAILILNINLFSQAETPQILHTILVPNTTIINLEQSINEFAYYHFNKSRLNYDNSYIEATYDITWPNEMLMWESGFSTRPWPRWTAGAVISYARAYRTMNDDKLATEYMMKAILGAEFLLCIQSQEPGGGIWDSMLEDDPAPAIEGRTDESFNTSYGGIAFIECFKSFGDEIYKTAAIEAAEWIMEHPTYPYEFPGDPYRYYSNANHQARQLLFLSEIYRITGNQTYLDRAIQIAEEIICWQDYQDSRDPWNEPIGPNGEWDGGWYYYDYAPIPEPECSPDEGPQDGIEFDRRMAYHQSVVLGLAKLLEVTSQQSLPGTITLKNGETFLEFRNNLINSITKGLNFMIDNQEEVDDFPQYRGMFKEYKNHTHFAGLNPTPITIETSAPHGMNALIESYISLHKLDAIYPSDLNRLLTLIYSLSENCFGVTSTGSWAIDEWVSDAMMWNWSHYPYYIEQINNFTEMTLRNPGFEDAEIIWELWSWDGYGVEISNNFSSKGQSSLHILDQSVNHSKWGAILVEASPNLQYKLEAYAYIISGFQTMYLEFLNKKFERLAIYESLAFENGNFTKETLIRTAPAGTKYIRISLYAPWYYESEGYWDDVTLTTQLNKELEQYSADSYTVQAYPNPFNPSTKIIYYLPDNSNVNLKVYDILGNEICTLVNELQQKGIYEVEFQAEDLASGTYIYRLQRGDNIAVRKILLLK